MRSVLHEMPCPHAALPLFLSMLLLADPRLSRYGKKSKHQQVRTLQGKQLGPRFGS